jgi:hypothetical protein
MTCQMFAIFCLQKSLSQSNWNAWIGKALNQRIILRFAIAKRRLGRNPGQAATVGEMPI